MAGTDSISSISLIEKPVLDRAFGTSPLPAHREFLQALSTHHAGADGNAKPALNLPDSPGTFILAQNRKKSIEAEYQTELKALQNILDQRQLNKLRKKKLHALAVLMANPKKSVTEVARLLNYKGHDHQVRSELNRVLQNAAQIIHVQLGRAFGKNPDTLRFFLHSLPGIYSQLGQGPHSSAVRSLSKFVNNTTPKQMVWGIHHYDIKLNEARTKLRFKVTYRLSDFVDVQVLKQVPDAVKELFEIVVLEEVTAEEGEGLNYRNPEELKRYGSILLDIIEIEWRDQNIEVVKSFMEGIGWTFEEGMTEMAKMYTQGLGRITEKQKELLRAIGGTAFEGTGIGFTDEEAEQAGEEYLVDRFAETHPDRVNNSRYFPEVAEPEAADTLQNIIEQGRKANNVIREEAEKAINLTIRILPAAKQVLDIFRETNLSSFNLSGVRKTLGQAREAADNAAAALEVIRAISDTLDGQLPAGISIPYLELQTNNAEELVTNAETEIDRITKELQSLADIRAINATAAKITADINLLSETIAQAKTIMEDAERVMQAGNPQRAVDLVAKAGEHIEQAKLIEQRLSKNRVSFAENIAQQINVAKETYIAFDSISEQANSALSQADQKLLRKEQTKNATDTLSLVLQMPESIEQYENLPENLRELLIAFWINPEADMQQLLEQHAVAEEDLVGLGKAQNDGINSVNNVRRFITAWRAIAEGQVVQSLVRNSNMSEQQVADAQTADVEKTLALILSNPSLRGTPDGSALLRQFAGGYTEGVGLWRLVSALEQYNHHGLADGFRLSEKQSGSLPQQVGLRVKSFESVAMQRLVWLLNQYSPDLLEEMGIERRHIESAVMQLGLDELDQSHKLHDHLQRHQENETPEPSDDFFEVGGLAVLGAVSSTKAITALKRVGFTEQKTPDGKPRGKGDHIFYQRINSQGKEVVVGLVGGKKDLTPGMVHTMLSDARITAEQFHMLLNGKVPEDLWSEEMFTESGQVDHSTDNDTAGAAEGITDSLNTDSQSASDPMSQHKAEDRQLFSTKDNAKNGEYDRNASGIKPLEKKPGMIGVVPNISGAVKDSRPFTGSPQETGMPSQSIEYSPPVIKPPSIDITQTDPVEPKPDDYNTLPDHIQSVLPENVYQASGLNAAEVNARYETYNQLHPEVRGEFSVFVKLHSNTIDLLKTRSVQIDVQNAELEMHNEKAQIARQLQKQLTQLQTTPTTTKTPEPKTQPASMERITLLSNTPPAQMIRDNPVNAQNNIVSANLNGAGSNQQTGNAVNMNAVEIPMISLKGKQGSVVNSFISTDSVPQYMLRNTQTGLQLQAVIEKPGGELAFITIPNIKIPAGAKATQFNTQAQSWNSLPQLSQQQLNDAQAYLQSIQQATIIPAAPTTGAPVSVPGGVSVPAVPIP